MELSGKTIVITGAARGLGRELALLLAGEGCRLRLVDKDAGGLEAISAQLPGGTQNFTCDLGEPQARMDLIQALSTQTHIDILVNCAGVGSHSTLGQMDRQEIERVLQVNSLAPLELISALSPLELIVNIGSVAAEMALPSMGLYAASKSALHVFSRAIDLEGARCLLAILGPMRGTEFVQSIRHPHVDQPQWYRDLDLDAKVAARKIVSAMRAGKRQIVLPGWYRAVIILAAIFRPVIKALGGKART